jgi:dihydroorotate dehydrogenase
MNALSMRIFLDVYRVMYENAVRPHLFRGSPQQAHDGVLNLLRWSDKHDSAQVVLNWLHRLAFAEEPVEIGGVCLPHPLILAAGFVKGQGFASEDEAWKAVQNDDNIIPGWRSMSPLVGAVEFGSFTRWPRLGNPGTVLWRDPATYSLQNRVGLKNPGARAAAEFFSARAAHLPRVFGINIAASPGISDPEQEKCEILEAMAFFVSHGVTPAWFTLNLSCPNTEDDPGSRQTERRARQLCQAVCDDLTPLRIPVWVKVSPGLAAEQYRALMRVFADCGVAAVIATNTQAEPAPGNPDQPAGVSGGRLARHTDAAIEHLLTERSRWGYEVDVIACGGVLDGATYAKHTDLGIKAVQYWTALIYRGPLAAAVIHYEAKQLRKIGHA